MPCFAFLDGVGKLDHMLRVVALQCRNRMRRAALGDHIARTSFAAAALGGNAEFELHFVKAHPGACITRNFSVGHSAANADDHGGRAAMKWLAVGGAQSINENPSHLQ